MTGLDTYLQASQNNKMGKHFFLKILKEIDSLISYWSLSYKFKVIKSFTKTASKRLHLDLEEME